MKKNAEKQTLQRILYIVWLWIKSHRFRRQQVVSRSKERERAEWKSLIKLKIVYVYIRQSICGSVYLYVYVARDNVVKTTNHHNKNKQNLKKKSQYIKPEK